MTACFIINFIPSNPIFFVESKVKKIKYIVDTEESIKAVKIFPTNFDKILLIIHIQKINIIIFIIISKIPDKVIFCKISFKISNGFVKNIFEIFPGVIFKKLVSPKNKIPNL